MKICFVGPASSGHMVKWCNWFSGRGHEVHLISFDNLEIPGTILHFVDAHANARSGDFAKLKYLLTGRKIRKIINSIHPDVVNAHYATSYGAAIALSRVKGYVLSVWGSDVYDFPKKSPLHKALLKYSLKKAAYLFSTSKAMAKEAAKYTDKLFEITPFGVDMELFNPNKRTSANDTPFTICTVKTLSEKYGIDYLLKAIAIIKDENEDLNVAVRIAGEGPKVKEYKELVRKLGIEKEVTFLGKISQEQAAVEWANMDVAVIPSTLESKSFGVSAVEAQACSTPIIISDIPGLMESTSPGNSSVVVPRENARAIANAIMRMYKDPGFRRKMGIEGEKNVAEKYELNKCFGQIENILAKIAGGGVIKEPYVYVFLYIARKKHGSRVSEGNNLANVFQLRKPQVLVLATGYPDNTGSISQMFVHSRNVYYATHEIDVSVLNFDTKEGYLYQGIPVMSLSEYEKCAKNYDVVISHAPNIRNHYRFLKKYGNRFRHIFFFFHGHEVLKIHEVYPKPFSYAKRSLADSFIQNWYDDWKLWIWRHYFPQIRSKSTYIFVSQWMKEMFENYLRLDIALYDVHVIPNVMSKIFQEKCYAIQDEKRYDFITIRGNLDGSKYCVDVVNRFAIDNPRLKFLLIGKGDFFKYNRRADNLEWRNVRMEPHDIPKVLDSSRCALMPTRCDAQGVMMCEMAVYGIPVITSDIDVCRELEKQFSNMFLIDNESSPDLRGYLEKCRRVYNLPKNKSFNEANTVQKEVKLLREKCAG